MLKEDLLSQKKENQNLKDNKNLNHNPKLLETLKVIEIGQHIAAPFASKLLADLGADVIKVEPLEGDVARQIGPFPNNIENPEKSGLFLSLNTSKLGITIDFDNKEHINRLYHLLETFKFAGHSGLSGHYVPNTCQMHPKRRKSGSLLDKFSLVGGIFIL